jgi:hypothetical protein
MFLFLQKARNIVGIIKENREIFICLFLIAIFFLPFATVFLPAYYGYYPHGLRIEEIRLGGSILKMGSFFHGTLVRTAVAVHLVSEVQKTSLILNRPYTSRAG